MNAELTAIARSCLKAAHDGSLAFPDIIGTLMDNGFEGYAVDYRSGMQTFYTTDGDHCTLGLDLPREAVAEKFDPAVIEALVRWAQANGPDYTYPSFSSKVQAAGCAGYLVSFSGRRVVYYGRTAEMHVEHFPQ